MKSTLTSALAAVALILGSVGTGIAHQKDRVEINGAATSKASSSSACQKDGCYVVAGSRHG